MKTTTDKHGVTLVIGDTVRLTAAARRAYPGFDSALPISSDFDAVAF